MEKSNGNLFKTFLAMSAVVGPKKALDFTIILGILPWIILIWMLCS